MKPARYRLAAGVYLVIDPEPGADSVLPRVEAALRGGVSLLQVWNHWAPGQDARTFVGAILALARPWDVPVLVHEDVELLRVSHADGIHYDSPGLAPTELRTRLARTDLLYGITCGNDLDRVRWAAGAGADYVSFCSMFASPSAGACELVSFETVAAARALRDRQERTGGGFRIFASGGITPENAPEVLEAGADGVAVISGILGADDPAAAAQRYVRLVGGQRKLGS